MNEKTCHYSPRATLAAIGVKLCRLDLLTPIKKTMKMNHKTIKHSLMEKLEDALQ